MVKACLCATLAALLLSPPVLPGRNAPVVIGYVFSRNRIINPSEISATRLTHINYAFANIADGRIAQGFSNDPENFKVLTGLRRQNPRLKILISVGGWTWSGGFSDMALTRQTRLKFIESAVEFVRLHDLDGVDIDWEYPGLAGIGNKFRAEDKQNFTALLTELRTALDREGKAHKRNYLVTFVAGANVPECLAQMELKKVQAVVDFVNLMTYDFRGSESDPVTGHHANLYVNAADDKRLSADAAVREYLKAGVPAAKIVLGVPFYGKTWGDVKPAKNGLYQPGKPPSERIDASFGNLSKQFINMNGYVRMWDDQAQAPYLWNEARQIFITYEDPESVRLKCRYIRQRHLGGIMFWEYFADTTGSLLGTIAKELRQ